MTRIIVNSIPKSGTHLVERALALLGVSQEKPLFLSGATAGDYVTDRGETVPIGVGMPVRVSVARLRQALMDLPEGQVVTAHVPHSSGLERLLRELDFRMILIVRDPRDVAVSLAHHITREPAHRLHAAFANLTPEERLARTIAGCDQLEDVSSRFASVLPWVRCDLCLLVRFEDLVGEKGGGDDESQQRTLAAICRHLRLDCRDLAGVGRELFGSSATFRKGTVGQWREQFTPAHHDTFAKVALPLLAELGYR